MASTKLKRAARARAEATGERYTTALARVQESLVTQHQTKSALALVSEWLTMQRVDNILRGEVLLYSVANTPLSIKHHRPSYGDEEESGYTLECANNKIIAEQATPQATADLIIFILDKTHFAAERVENEKHHLQLTLVDAELKATKKQLDALASEVVMLRAGLPDAVAALEQSDKLSGNLTLYSTQRFTAGEVLAHANYRVFAVPLGTRGQGFVDRSLSRAETNLREGGRVPGSYGCTFNALHVELINGSDEDAENLRTNAALAFEWIQTITDIAPLSRLIGPGKRTGSILLSDLYDSSTGVQVDANMTFSVLVMFGHDAKPVEDQIMLRIMLISTVK